MHRVEELGRSDRVQVDIIGKTSEERAIPLITIAEPEVIATLDTVRRQHIARALPVPMSAADAESRTIEPAMDPDGPLPVLFVSSDHGFEASQVHALLELSEHLARSTDPRVESMLHSVIVLVVPVISPDGYERSRAEWMHSPLSSGLSGDGNLYGIGVTREYLYSEQPETLALAGVIQRWQPGLVWELHEDGVDLGEASADVVLATLTGERRNGDRGDAEPLDRLEERIGVAIVDAWRANGFDVRHERSRRHGWAQSHDCSVSPPALDIRLTHLMMMQRVATVVTLGGRTPGSQSWQDRNEQKRIAALAILDQVAEIRKDILASRRDLLRQAMEEESDGYYLIPTDQDPAAVQRATALLARTGILFYRPGDGEDGIVVPRRQPFKATADLMLCHAPGADYALVDAIGLRVVESADPPPRAASPLLGLAASGWQARSVVDDELVHARRAAVGLAGLDAVPAVNRILRIPGARVSWRMDGTFVARLPRGEGQLADIMRGIHPIVLDGVDDPSCIELTRSPRIGVYAGQGVRDLLQLGGLGRIRWFMRVNKFDVALISPSDILSGALSELDVLLVPAGDAREILRGWSDADTLRRFPWDLPGKAEGLAGEGVSAIRRFVDAGGTFIGIDGGGGWLATRDHAHLLDTGIENFGFASRTLRLRPEAADDHLFAGFGPTVPVPGGTVFCHGTSVRRMAGYLSPEDGGAAIVEGDVGSGTALLFGFDPTYRSIALRSAQMLSNALLRAVCD